MTKHVLWSALALGAWAVSPAPAGAQDAPFQVLSAAVHSEAREAEACLTLSARAQGDRQTLAGQIKLSKNGKKQNVDPQAVDFAASQLCVGGLEHGASYALRLGRIASEDGRRLVRSYDYAFEVPHRKAALSFIGPSDLASFPRHARAASADGAASGQAHVLRSVNVPSVRLTLYRLDDPDTLVPGWQQFVQNAWTPSEGLYYARRKGKSVFESDLVFGDKPDEEQTLLAPLPEQANLTPGLYFLSAAPRGKEEKNPGLSAGQWFVVSDVRVGALLTPGALAAFVSNGQAHKAVAGAQVQLLDREGKVLAAGVSDGEGKALLPLDPKDHAAAALVVARTQAGDIDLLDLKRARLSTLIPATHKATLTTDRDFYASGTKAALMLRLTDLHGASRKEAKGTLRLLRPDRHLHEQRELTVTDGVAVSEWTLPVAQESGVWTLEWSEGEKTLASAPLTLAAWGASGRVELEAPGAVIASDKGFTVRLRASETDGKIRPFASGRLLVRAVRMQSELWKDYRFGLPVDPATAWQQDVPFIADADGTARLTINPEGQNGEIQALALTPVLEGGALGETKTVRLVTRGASVGIKASAGERIGPGLTVVRLDALTLDAEGRKKTLPRLHYALIEEGRSFEWYQADGYWDYTPLPQRRRIAAGDVTFTAEGEAQVTRALTPGQYTVEVSEEDGTLLARAAFTIGPDGAMETADGGAETVRWQNVPDSLDVKKQANLSVRLDAPATLALIAADQKVRVFQVKTLPAGTHNLTFVPQEDWGEVLSLRAIVLTGGSAGPDVIEKKVTLRDPRRAIALAASLPRDPVLAGSELTLPLRATPGEKDGEIHYALSVTPDPACLQDCRDTLLIKGARFDAAGKAAARLTIPDFDGPLQIELTAWNDKSFGAQRWTVPVRHALAVTGAPPARLVQGDQADVYVTLMNANGPDAAYAYELRVPRGIELKGAAKGQVKLGRQASQTLAFTLDAKLPLNDQIVLTTTTPGGVSRSFVWPLTVRSAAPLADLSETKLWAPDTALETSRQGVGRDALALVSPVSLPPSTPRLLQTLAMRAPLTTIELARWLEAARLWQQPLIEGGFVGEARFEQLKTERLQQLMRRQNEDGGFASTRTGRQSDMQSTAAALSALAGQNEPGSDRAAAWLTQKLQNTWFDEAERNDRALAFEALDAVRKADVAALRYFEETSRHQTLSPQAVSALALVFARSTDGQDKDKAKYWLDRYRASAATPDWLALAYAARNGGLSPEAWQGLSPGQDEEARESSLEDAALRLSAYAHAAQRTGTWRVSLGGANAKHYGIHAMDLSPEILARGLKNEAGRPLLWALMTRTARKDRAEKTGRGLRAGPSLALHFFSKDGARIDPAQPLSIGETYLLSVETEGRVAGADQARLIVPVSGAFESRTPLIGAEGLVRDYVPSLPFTPSPALALSATPDAVRWDFDASRPWRGVIFLKAAHRGSFAWPAPLLELESGERVASPVEPVRLIVK